MPTESSDDAGAGTEPGVEAAGNNDVSSDDRNWGVLTHAAAFAGFAVPFGNILGPLLVWLIKKDESWFVDANGTQALNFQITWTIFLTIALFTVIVGLGLILLPLVVLAWLIFVVIAMIRASEGEVYEYPLTIDLIS